MLIMWYQLPEGKWSSEENLMYKYDKKTHICRKNSVNVQLCF